MGVYRAVVAELASQAGASVVVLSSATADSARAARAARAEAGEITRPGLRVLAGQVGDTLGELRRLARSAQA